jgi:hypothetical protein
MNSASSLFGRSVLLLCVCHLAACSKLTADNYARIKAGMEYKEVTGILGTPDRCDDFAGFKACTWGEAKSHVTVRFAGEKVILHSAENIR